MGILTLVLAAVAVALAAGLVLARRRLRRLAAELARRHAESDAFVQVASHDVRAPLRAISGFSQALRDDCADRLDPAGQDYLRRILAASSIIESILDGLVAFHRLGRADLALRTVQLEQAWAEALAQREARIRETGAQVTAANPMPSVTAHPGTLVQLMAILLENALNYTVPGSVPEVRVWAEPRGARVRLWVEDRGIGIAPEHHERIFRLGERLHGRETYPGTGVGLAIVRKGVERMGGGVGVESELEAGARFWIELPRGEG